jgi:hypothetical protein
MRPTIQISLLPLLLCIAVYGMAQTSDSAVALSSWTQVDKSDPLHDISFKEFTLQGKFLVPARQSTLTAPAIVLHCQPGLHTHGKVQTNGHFVEGWITTGSVLDSSIRGNEIDFGGSVRGAAKRASEILVEFRLDAKKLQQDLWPISTDRTGVFLNNPTPFCGDCTLENLLYGSVGWHMEGKGNQVRKVLLGVPEYLGAQIQMQFDLSDSTEVADACGVIAHKR